MRTSSVSSQIEWPRAVACVENLNSFYVQRSYPGYEDPEYDKQTPTLIMQHEEKTSQFIIGKGSPEMEKFLQYVYNNVHKSLLLIKNMCTESSPFHWSKEDTDSDSDADDDDEVEFTKKKDIFLSKRVLEMHEEHLEVDILRARIKIEKINFKNAMEYMYAAIRVAVRWCDPCKESSLKIHELWKLAKQVQEHTKTMCLPLIKISLKRVEHLKEQIVLVVIKMVNMVMYEIPKTMEYVHAFQQVITFSKPEKLSKNIIATRHTDRKNKRPCLGKNKTDLDPDVPVYFKNFQKAIGISSMEFPVDYADFYESLHQWSVDLLRILPPVQEFQVGTFPLYKLGAYLHSMYTLSANLSTFRDTDLYKLLAECNNWLNLFYQNNCANITNEDNLDVKDNITYKEYKAMNASRFSAISTSTSSSSSSSSEQAPPLKKVELISFEDVVEYIDSLGKPRLIPTIQIAKRHIDLQEQLQKFSSVIDKIPSDVFIKENGIASNKDLGDASNPKTHSSFCKPSSIMWNLLKKVTLDILTDPCEIELASGKTSSEIVFCPVWLYTWTVYELVSEFPIFDNNNNKQQQEDEMFLWFFIGKWIFKQIEDLSFTSVPLVEKKYSLLLEKHLYPFQKDITILPFIYMLEDHSSLDVVSKFVYHSTLQAIRFCSKNLYSIATRHSVSFKFPKFELANTDKENEKENDRLCIEYLYKCMCMLKHIGGYHRLEKWILHCIFHANFQNRVIANTPAFDFSSEDASF